MDGRVIDAPLPIRFMIVEGFILPFRPKNSAEAYEQIWTKEGSPLISSGRKTVEALFIFIDWVMCLPEELDKKLEMDLHLEENEEEVVEFVHSFQRIAEERGKKDGIVIGEKNGKVLGARDALLTQLQAKFGELPEPVIEQINEADQSKLMNWLVAVLNADTLDELFGT